MLTPIESKVEFLRRNANIDSAILFIAVKKDLEEWIAGEADIVR